MKRINLCILLILAGCSILNAQELASSKQKARDILTRYGEATGLTKNKSIGSLLSLTETGIEPESKVKLPSGIEYLAGSSFKQTLDFEAPCQVRTKLDTTHSSLYKGVRSENQQVDVNVLNGEAHYLNSAVYQDDKKLSAPFQYPTREEAIANTKKTAFKELFPIILDKFQCMPMEFDFVGIAESKDTRASIVETTSPDGVKYRMFFDEKTHLLLMMVETSGTNDNQKRERRYFYSDYKMMGGLLVASLIKTEKDGKLIETREIRALDLKPAFKPDLFKVSNK